MGYIKSPLKGTDNLLYKRSEKETEEIDKLEMEILQLEKAF